MESMIRARGETGHRH